MHSDTVHLCCNHGCLSQAVAECVDAQVPESVIRQVGENEYQAKLHELQLKVNTHQGSPHFPVMLPIIRHAACAVVARLCLSEYAASDGLRLHPCCPPQCRRQCHMRS